MIKIIKNFEKRFVFPILIIQRNKQKTAKRTKQAKITNAERHANMAGRWSCLIQVTRKYQSLDKEFSLEKERP